MRIIKIGAEKPKRLSEKPEGKNWLSVELVVEATENEPEKHFAGRICLEPIAKIKE